MGRKRKRPSPAAATASTFSSSDDFPWKKVENVGLMAPSIASATTSGSRKKGGPNEDDDDDDDFAEEDGILQNHYDEPKSDLYRSAERELEADPHEGMGIFLGLEVLDGDQYDLVVGESGNKRIVPKATKTKTAKTKSTTKGERDTDDDDEDSSAKKKGKGKSKPQKKDEDTNTTNKRKPSILDETNEVIPKLESGEDDNDDEDAVEGSGGKGAVSDEDGNATSNEKKKKKKKKNKKKKKKKNASEDANPTSASTDSENDSKERVQKGSSPEDDVRSVKKTTETSASVTTAEKTSDSTTTTTTTTGTTDAEKEEIESIQTSWLTATGGVTLQEQLCKSLLKQNFWNPTPIQAASLPAAILGRRNVVGAAPTGSGKTLAYLLPIFEFLLQQKQHQNDDDDRRCKVQALILAPTRELALQVSSECDKLVKGQCGILVGGLATQKQERVLRKNKPPIIIATPGRLWEMISSRDHEHLNDLSQLAFLVIDECDRMTEQGSFPQLHSILDAVERANPMDESDEEGEEGLADDGMSDDEFDPDRLMSLPGVKGESKVVMLNDELLAMIEKQRGDQDEAPPEPVEIDDAEFDEARELEEEKGLQDDNDEDEISLPMERPVFRQTFVYSATLTLPPSASYIPSRNKGKRMYNLKGLEGAIEEILDKSRARGQTKVIDLSNSKKQAKFNEKILESKERSRGEKNKKQNVVETTTNRSFNLPPGLKLQEIQCTQMHKDSHLYAYLVTTKEGSAGPCLIFCNSIKAVKRVGNTLKELGLPVRMLHAQMQQRARFRSVESLQSESRAIVVATDVAARGLDIPSVATVVHYDVARKVDGFVHRAGRTARGMGEKAVGSSLSLISPAEDRAHSKIVGELNATFYRVNLDSRLLAAAQERANLASKIIAAEKVEGKAQRDNQWFIKSAEDAGLEIDGDMLDDGLAGGNLKDQQQLREAQRAKGVLKRLLAEPMVTQRFGKFLSSNAAASKPDVAPFVVPTQNKRAKKRRRKGK